MQNVTQAVLNAFKPIDLLASAAQKHALKHQDLHTAAVAKLGSNCFMLQHHMLSFVTDLLSAEPLTLQHLRAEALWELAYGHQLFFWGCSAHKGRGNLTWLVCSITNWR